MKKPWLVLVSGLLAAVLVSGCSLAGEKWVAKVNGENISMNELDQRLAASEALYQAQGVDFKSDQGKQMETQLKSSILERIVQGRIIAQEVRKEGLSTSDSQIKQEEASLKKNFPDEAHFQDALKQQGMTEEELLNFLALYQKVTADVKVSDADVKKYFDEHKDQYGHPEQVQAKHILVKTEDEAKAIIAQLKAGADFTTLAKEKSIEPGAKDTGGELGTFGRGEMDPDFEKAAFSQPVGTFSQTPVKSQFGYHVILVEAHLPAVQPDFEKSKAQVEQDALTAAKDNKFEAYANDLLSKAKVDYAQGFKPADTNPPSTNPSSSNPSPTP